jgi:hypothetical protein
MDIPDGSTNLSTKSVKLNEVEVLISTDKMQCRWWIMVEWQTRGVQ